MAINFPDAPTEGQVHQGFVFTSGAWAKGASKTALPKNYIINPAAQISNQNGDTVSAAGASGDYYAADQWLSRWAVTAAVLRTVRYNALGAGLLPFASTYLEVTTVKATLGAGEYAIITQRIEGNRVADLQWGTAKGIPAVLRFRTAATVSGTYSVRVANAAQTRCFVATFNSNPAWQEHVIAIPAPPADAAVWATDHTTGVNIDFVFGIGSTYVGAAGWNTSNKYTIAGATNGIATLGAFHIGGVGFHPDPYGTGLAPPWAVPNYFDEQRRCTRYWNKIYGTRGAVLGSATGTRQGSRPSVPMRTTPALAIVGAPMVHASSNGALGIGTVYAPPGAIEFDCTMTGATFVVGRPLLQYFTSEADYVAANARL